MNKQQQKIQSRVQRHGRVRAIISGTAQKPRLAVFRASQNIYAQIIDDVAGKTLTSASSLELKKAKAGKSKKSEVAAEIGSLIAKKAQEKNITEVVFDRGGFKYHGRVKALAEAARAAGLKF